MVSESMHMLLKNTSKPLTLEADFSISCFSIQMDVKLVLLICPLFYLYSFECTCHAESKYELECCKYVMQY